MQSGTCLVDQQVSWGEQLLPNRFCPEHGWCHKNKVWSTWAMKFCWEGAEEILFPWESVCYFFQGIYLLSPWPLENISCCQVKNLKLIVVIQAIHGKICSLKICQSISLLFPSQHDFCMYVRIYVPALFRAQAAGGAPLPALKEKSKMTDFLSEVIAHIRFETASNTNRWSQNSWVLPFKQGWYRMLFWDILSLEVVNWW